jgi:hypothetical protein
MSDAQSLSPRAQRLASDTAIRLAILVWLAIYIPTYTHAYGAWHFLQLCNLGVLLSSLGALARSRLLLSTQAVAMPAIGLLWLADLGWWTATGRYLHGGTAYLWDAEIPRLARWLSLYHLILPALLIATIRRMGYHPRAFVLQAAIAAAALSLSLLLAEIAGHHNYVLGWPNGRVLFDRPWAHALVSWLLLCVAAYWPTHLLWRRLFPTGAGSDVWHDAPSRRPDAAQGDCPPC